MRVIIFSNPSLGADYNSTELPSVITASDFDETVNETLCYDISLKMDSILEGSETIQLELSHTESFVAITQATATLTITDEVSYSLVYLCILTVFLVDSID